MIYNRILLKLSGEALLGDRSHGIDSKTINKYSEEIKSIVDLGVEVSIVIGGGNIFRGLSILVLYFEFSPIFPIK